MAQKTGRVKLGVIYPPGLDHASWELRYGAGEVPDQWPYGLNQLDSADAEAIAFESHGATLADKAALAKILMGGQRPARKNLGLDLGIAWDEYTAAKMVTQFPAERMFAGVIWATDMWRNGTTLRGEVLKRTLQKLDGLWCLSRPQTYELESHLGRGTRVDFLSFGIDLNFFPYAEQPAGLRVLSLGVDRDRDPRTLFEALEIVHKAMPSAEIMVQTDSNATLPQGVTKFSRIPHHALRKLYAASNVVLIPTKQNLHASGMTVALEAAATGRPVVVSATPGMDDYVLNGHTGFLAPVGNSRALAAATIDILADRESARVMGINARRHVEANHSSRKMVASLQELIMKWS